MPLYIKDAEVSRIADELAAKSGDSKTGIVRRLLREESARLQRLQTSEERPRQLRKIGKRGAATVSKSDPPLPYAQKDAAEMFKYLEPGVKPATRRKRRTP